MNLRDNCLGLACSNPLSLPGRPLICSSCNNILYLISVVAPFAVEAGTSAAFVTTPDDPVINPLMSKLLFIATALMEVGTTTGQITHHIASDVDQERDCLSADLKSTGNLQEDYAVDDFHTRLEARNCGGDRWFTDGRRCVGVIEAPKGEQVAP